ncbi:uncharacterized protein [Eucyclogobius newberryi]|uniref:uncharacterized protein n=1 Tax=Eucyclogobius newberryi TaxID=166745 RepID=UPI003B5A8285
MARTSSLILLLSLLTGAVTMMTALGRGVSCHREVHPELLREIWKRTRQLQNVLPKEEKPSRGARLLPKFCTKCQEGAIGWLEIREMIDIYQRSVFSQDEVQKLLPLHFPDLLYRLQHTLHHCVPKGKPSKWSKIIKKVEKKIKKNLASPEVGSNPLFTSVIRSLNSPCQVREDVMLMNSTLDVYMKIFSSLLHHKKEPFSDLKKLRDHMSKLKSQLSHLQQNKEDLISKINAIKVDDPLVQRKVLAEFLEVYHATSGLLQSRDHGYTH